MPDFERSSAVRTTLFCLHYLGGSAREWTTVAGLVAGAFDLVALDLPGFGDAAQQPGYGVTEMAETIARTIAAAATPRWMLVGHSMGAKVAAAVARAAEDGTPGLAGLVGIVLLAGSPPGPEPIPDVDRATMLGWFSTDAATSLTEATAYVAKNGGPHLPARAAELAVADVLRANPSAWRSWLTAGSREDLSEHIGILRTPALVLAGADDANLGPDAQRRLMAPHLADVRIVTLPEVRHLLPLEAAERVAREIAEHARAIEQRPQRAPVPGERYRALIASERVGRVTRAALYERGRPDDPAYAPVALSPAALEILRAALARVIPQSDAEAIDLSARIDARLASGASDGWRFAELPSDVEAYRIGLATLDASALERDGLSFTALDAAAQDALLARIAAGVGASNDHDTSGPKRFDSARLRAWFEDLRADAVALYMAHPRTLERIGYSGIANGGDGLPKSGFARVGIGERETWEPLAAADATS